MSDLVKRLQAASRDDRLADGMLYREAADEIERLRVIEKAAGELIDDVHKIQTEHEPLNHYAINPEVLSRLANLLHQPPKENNG